MIKIADKLEYIKLKESFSTDDVSESWVNKSADITSTAQEMPRQKDEEIIKYNLFLLLCSTIYYWDYNKLI